MVTMDERGWCPYQREPCEPWCGYRYAGGEPERAVCRFDDDMPFDVPNDEWGLDARTCGRARITYLTAMAEARRRWGDAD